MPPLAEEFSDFEEQLAMMKVSDVTEKHGEHRERCSNIQLAAAGCTLWALQLVWSTIFARGTSYLTHIGIPISTSALLWTSGPLAGMLVQPMMGALSDSYSHKRKPFILAGAIATAASMTGLAFIPNIVVFLEKFCGHEYETPLLIANAVVWVCSLSIAVQPLQGGIRTLLHEIVSKKAQAQSTAWQGVLIAFGTVCGYFLASVPIGGRSGAWEEISRFQNLSILVSMVVLLCSAITVLCPFPETQKQCTVQPERFLSLRDMLRRNLDCLCSLPKSAQLTLQVQFLSWLGWFPALYYQTAYLTDLSKATQQQSDGSRMTNAAEQAALDAMPSTMTMLVTSFLIALASSRSWRRAQDRSAAISAVALTNLWLAGHLLFAVSMGWSIFAGTETEGVWVFALVGVSRALSTWVPFALIGREVTGSRYAGTLTSLHNAAISAPQILAAGLCAILFWTARQVTAGHHGETTLAMLVACVAACLASWKNWQLQQMLRR